MKRIIAITALACVLTSAWAQDYPAGLRREVVEIEQNEDTYSLFSYKDEDGTFGYYLSLRHETPDLEIELFGIQGAIPHVDETCLCLGATKDEVLSTLDSLLALTDKEPGTTATFPCRRTSLTERLTVPDTAECVVVKPFLMSKRLRFQFDHDGKTAEVDLSRSTLKSLRWSVDLDKKLGLNE